MSLNVEGHIETVAGFGTTEYLDKFLEHKGTKERMMGYITCKETNGCKVSYFQRASIFSAKAYKRILVTSYGKTKEQRKL